MEANLQIELDNRRALSGKNVAIGLLFALLAVAPLFLSSYYVNLLYMVGVFAIISIGMNIIVGYSGIVSIGHAGLMAAGAYSAAFFNTHFGTPFWITAMIGIVVSLILGSILAIPTIRAGGVYLSMITIAFGVIIDEILIRWESFSGGPLGISGIAKPAIGAYQFGLTQVYYLVLIVAVVAMVLVYNFRRSVWGRSLLAIKQNVIAAESLGIKPFYYQYVGFAISAVFAGLAGAIYAHANSFISPDIFGFHTSIQLVLIIILGGAGTVWGPVLGSFIIVLLPEVLNFDHLRLAVYGLLMFVVLYFLPKGISGTIIDYLEKKKTPKENRAAYDAIPLEQLLNVNANTASGTLLSINNLNKQFGGLHVIKDLSLEVQSSTVLSLIGPNGAGKSTVINMISGFYTPTSGDIYLNGKKIDGSTPQEMLHQGIARTFQHTRLFGELTVLENIMIGVAQSHKQHLFSALFRSGGMRRQEQRIADLAHAYLDLAGYKGLRHIKAANLAYGHQRVVEIARALAAKPSLLLLDEPAAGLTSGEIVELEHVIRKLKEAGLTIILIEHHMDFVSRISDKVTVIDYGRKIAEGKADEVQDDPNVIKAYLGEEETEHADSL
ncbi:ABC transporter permease subunit [Paenibacillus validus]|uniref:branched-chain amino acid ABC transporter ATP-binding protein/permease n=1 Tax=Paenibacillus validus TaxID=44253 RepID=UPI003D287B1D